MSRETLELRSILVQTRAVLRHSFFDYLTVVAVAGLPGLLLDVLELAGGEEPPPLTQVAVLAISLVLTIIAQAMVQLSTIGRLSGIPIRLRETLGQALRMMPRLFQQVMLVSIAAAIGLMLAIVPGIVILMITFVAAPACVAENLDVVASLRRSAALTKGYRLRLAGMCLPLIALGLALLLGAGHALPALLPEPLPLFVLFFVGSALAACWTTLVAVIYTRLVKAKSFSLQAA